MIPMPTPDRMIREIAELRVVEKIVDTAEKDGVTLGFIKYKDAA